MWLPEIRRKFDDEDLANLMQNRWYGVHVKSVHMNGMGVKPSLMKLWMAGKMSTCDRRILLDLNTQGIQRWKFDFRTQVFFKADFEFLIVAIS